MANATFITDLPPLPAAHNVPIPPLLPFISDFWLSILAPHVAYWVASLFFHLIDIFDLFPQYRLHTPDEIAQRNLASRWQVFRDVILEQVLQVAFTTVLSLNEARQTTGGEARDVAVWATRVRLSQRSLPTLLGLLGVDARRMSASVAKTHPLIAGALAGGHYPFLTAEMHDAAAMAPVRVPAFAQWEMLIAKVMYWALIPAMQMMISIVALDTWQYFMHRAMHMNKWMYTNWHARHHRLYVPYAYGALYNHPVEGFFMDTIGAGLAYKVSGMSARMGMLFWVGSMIKTVDDHCGYALPWDPLQHLTSNNAAYHDIHHQSWGIKTNFSQPFFTVWDRWLDTMWRGDTELKYERARLNAERKKALANQNQIAAPLPPFREPDEIEAEKRGVDVTGQPKANGTAMNGKAVNGTANGSANGRAH